MAFHFLRIQFMKIDPSFLQSETIEAGLVADPFGIRSKQASSKYASSLPMRFAFLSLYVVHLGLSMNVERPAHTAKNGGETYSIMVAVHSSAFQWMAGEGGYHTNECDRGREAAQDVSSAAQP
ncbi:hypothetical protein SAMN06295960_3327 [Paenibacillus aquistagni]|uniref:Uncharacterized protein n=1 Tax=Paenibacillus aquistagni TaxID=1852522 RepID=A0A1X7LFH3_9BACL|nr:hypothetical protein SAMN06295960_3327 [Paenibacillus aquistagni]